MLVKGRFYDLSILLDWSPLILDYPPPPQKKLNTTFFNFRKLRIQLCVFLCLISTFYYKNSSFKNIDRCFDQ
jgi:hypothetical protein